MTEGLKDLGISIIEIEEAKQLLKKEIGQSLERKKELLMPILKNMKQLNLETDRLLFWIYGSSNPLVDQDLSLDTPSSKYGGCRMQLCEIFDYDEDADEFDDWFLGYCEECLLRIKYRHYSVRRPREHGGWKGCFCSWECVKKNVEFEEAQNAEANLLIHAIVDAFEKKTIEIGIQDRK